MNKQFEEWLRDYPDMYQFFIDGYLWKNIPWSFRWGVYLEFFDSVGIYIDVDIVGDPSFVWFIWNKDNHYQDKVDYTTRTEAQQEAIKKAFSLIE